MPPLGPWWEEYQYPSSFFSLFFGGEGVRISLAQVAPKPPTSTFQFLGLQTHLNHYIQFMQRWGLNLEHAY